MNHHLLTPVALLATLCADLAAQVTIPVNVRATYLRTNNDPTAVPAPGIPLSALGSGAGQLFSISTVGAYDNGTAGDATRTLVAVFSGSVTLLPDGQLNRVPGAIAAGPTYATPNTYSGNLTTNIGQDFIVGVSGWQNGIVVRVPAGATHVFVATVGPYGYGYHNDPNNDFAVVFDAGPAPTLPGTLEHCALRTGVGGTPSASPDIKTAAPFSTISAEIRQSYGVSNGALYVLAGTVFGTAGPVPTGPFVDLHLGSAPQLLQLGTVAATPGQWSLFTPPGFAGTTLLLQAGFLDPGSRNGLFMASNAHQIQFQ